jgi:hypothetical protein
MSTLPALRGKRKAPVELTLGRNIHKRPLSGASAAAPPPADPRPELWAALPGEVQDAFKEFKRLPEEKREGELPPAYLALVRQHAYKFERKKAATGVCWLCLHCGWCSTAQGPARLLMRWSGGFSGEAASEEVSSRRKAGNRAKSCSHFSLDDEQVALLAVEGQKDMKAEADRRHLEITVASGPTASTSASMFFPAWSKEDNAQARDLHVTAVVCSAHSFKGVEHRRQLTFCRKISKGRYIAPGRHRAKKLLLKHSLKLDAFKQQAYGKSKGTVVFDGAGGRCQEHVCCVALSCPAQLSLH